MILYINSFYFLIWGKLYWIELLLFDLLGDFRTYPLLFESNTALKVGIKSFWLMSLLSSAHFKAVGSS